MTTNTNTNDNKDNNKINISINLANPQAEIKKKKKYKKRKPRLTAQDKSQILGGSGGGNYATQTPVNYLPKYSDRSLGGGNFYSSQPFDNNQRLPLAIPYQLPQGMNGGIQYIPQQPQIQQIQPQQPQMDYPQQPQYDFQPQQPRMINVDGVPDNRALYDPINQQYMRPDDDRIQVVDAPEYLPDFEYPSRPTTSGSNPQRPNRPPPPLPDDNQSPQAPQAVPAPPQDIFQDALEMPQNDIVFTGNQKPRPEIQRKKVRLPPYIQRVGDNMIVEGTDYYVSKKEGLNLASQLYSRIGRGRFANKLRFSGMTYGEYLNTLREQPNIPQEPLIEQQAIQGDIRAEDDIDREVARLLDARPSSSRIDDREFSRLTGDFPPISRPPSFPRPPSTPKPYPPRPVTPSIQLSRDSPVSVSSDIVFTPDTADNLNFMLRQYGDITPEDFDKLTINLRKNGIPFDVPRELRGRVKLTADPVDINSQLPPEDRPDTSEKKNKSLLKKVSNIVSKYTTLRKTSKVLPNVSPEISPPVQEGQYEEFPPEEPRSLLDKQASQIRALLDETTQKLVVTSIDIPPIVPEIVPEIVPAPEDIDTTILPNEILRKQAERMRRMTGVLFDETTRNIVSPPLAQIQPSEEDIIKDKFEQKYYEPERRRPSSAKTSLEEALYQSKMDEIKPDLEDFDREYGFNYENYLEGQRIKKEDIGKMTDFLIKKYGISHKAGDLYIKEFLDTFSETERKQILKDYEQTIASNVSFYVNKLSKGYLSQINLATRLAKDASDENKKELFLRTIIDTRGLTSNFSLFANEDFREFLFQEYCKNNNIKLDNPRNLLEILTPVRYPYGARRKIVYRKPTPPISPSSISPPTPVSNQETKKLKFDEPSLPSVIEEQQQTPIPPPRRPSKALTPIRRTKREQQEIEAIANRQPILPPPPPPPRRKIDAPKRPSIPKKK